MVDYNNSKIQKKRSFLSIGPNEVYKKDGNPCTDVCEKDRIKCALQSVPGCYCIDGYARNSSGICVKYPCCGTNEEYTNGNRCSEGNCGKNKVCTLELIQGCFCKTGFKRDGNGNCVEENKCCTGE